MGREKWDRGRGRFFSGFPFFFPQHSSDRVEDSPNFAVGRLILNAGDGSGSGVDRGNGNGNSNCVVNGFAGGVNWHFVDFTAADTAKHSSNSSEM